MNLNMTAADILKLVEMLSHSIEVEERHCEQRITFFLTLATATIGGVNLLDRISRLGHEQFYYGMLAVFFSLLFYGLHTLNRMNWRSIEIGIWRNQMNNALQELSAGAPLIERHLGFHRQFDHRVQAHRIIGRVKGSPAEFMYITNALIITGIALTLALRAHWFAFDIILLCTSICIFSFVLLWKTSVHMRRKFSSQ